MLDTIAGGPAGAIAVTVIQWSSSQSQVVAVPWLRINDAVSAATLAQIVSTMPRQTAEGGTSISAAIDAGIELHRRNPFRAARQVIDVQADGTNNNGRPVMDARDTAVALGITVNGLTILNEVNWLHFYFRNRVIGGAGSFVEIANNYSAYGRAIRTKLLKEIAPPYLF